jgi:amino acid adenylation domain-containing protein
VVAVLLPKGCAAVAVMLGILEAGGAYLVLSNTDPADRLFEILVDARYPLLVTDERSGRVPPAYAGDVVTVQWLMREAEQVGDAPLNASVTLDDRAYILYTSGTTGRPKGVEHTHLQLVNYATWAGEAYPLHEHESVALHASLAFAGCISSLFPALAHGWAIDAAPEAIHVSELAHYYAGVNLGFLKLTPSLARVLSLSQEYMLTARQIMVSSEAFIAAEWVRRWLLQHSEIRFLHHYGLSETCGGTCGPIRHDDLVAGEAVPCGRPIFNSGVFVVRPDLTLAPRGEVGEVYLGGAVLGRGYFNEPGRTALRWLPCPWGGAPGSVMLRTGDLGRLDCENRLAILGRADRQMKIRGVRVEPADVEAKLCSDGNIVDAVVVGKAARGGALSLVAYVVAKDATTFDARAVRKSLEGQVSRAAVPSKIVCVSELPLTPHGKLDIRKLQSEPDRDATQETGSVLRTLLASLSEIADVPPQAEDMSFIDVGGDSLAAVAFAVALTESLGIEVTPADLIDLRPLRALAEDLASRATRS